MNSAALRFIPKENLEMEGYRVLTQITVAAILSMSPRFTGCSTRALAS